MSVRNWDNFEAAAWDWSFLDDCFRHGIRVSDIDGTVERNWNFLDIETKPFGYPFPPPPGGKVNGQWKMYEARHYQGDTILFLFGERNDPVEMMRWYHSRKKPEPKEAADLGTVHQFVSEWFEWADKNPTDAWIRKYRARDFRR